MARKKAADATDTTPKPDRNQLYASMQTLITTFAGTLEKLGVTRDAAGNNVTPATDDAALVIAAAKAWGVKFNSDMRLYVGATFKKTTATKVSAVCVKARSDIAKALRKIENAIVEMEAAKEEIDAQETYFASTNDERKRAEIAANNEKLRLLQEEIRALETGTKQPKRRAPTKKKTAAAS